MNKSELHKLKEFAFLNLYTGMSFKKGFVIFQFDMITIHTLEEKVTNIVDCKHPSSKTEDGCLVDNI